LLVRHALLIGLIATVLSGCASQPATPDKSNEPPDLMDLARAAEKERTTSGPLSDAYLAKLVTLGEARLKANELQQAHDDFMLLYNTDPTSRSTLYKGIAAAQLAHILYVEQQFSEAAPLGKQAIDWLPPDQKERRVQVFHDLALDYWTVADQRDIRPYDDSGTKFARSCIAIDIPKTSEYFPLKDEIVRKLKERESRHH
jgi:hypothetical protein